MKFKWSASENEGHTPQTSAFEALFTNKCNVIQPLPKFTDKLDMTQYLAFLIFQSHQH